MGQGNAVDGFGSLKFACFPFLASKVINLSYTLPYCSFASGCFVLVPRLFCRVFVGDILLDMGTYIRYNNGQSFYLIS